MGRIIAGVARYVIDGPTLLGIADESIALDPEHQLVAPNRVRSDALEILYERVRRGELDERAARELHTRMTEVKMRLLGDRVSRWVGWQIASEQDWPTLGDAEYFAVTRLQADAFVTVDAGRTALAAGVVPVADVAVLAG